MKINLRKDLPRWLTLLALLAFFIIAARGMETKDWVITLLRGLSVGSVTFLVASGFSLIFGLLDVLNMAHGTVFMLGAYIAWTVYVRPDTFVDLLTPALLLMSGFTLSAVWKRLVKNLKNRGKVLVIVRWVGLVLGIAAMIFILPRYPITIWDVGNYSQSPVTYSYLADQGLIKLPPGLLFENISPLAAVLGLMVASLLTAFSLATFDTRSSGVSAQSWKDYLVYVIITGIGVIALIFNGPLTSVLTSLDTTFLFFIALTVGVLVGVLLGSIMESTLIRPLYSRPIYQLMLTLGLSAIGVEVVRAIWGRPEFVMPKPSLFAGVGDGCPATSLADLWSNHCSTILLFDGRIRVYNEIFIPMVGLIVLVGIWILLQRSRLGMVIRAGVQDREMVEALGINVQRVFNTVFAMGAGLAVLGGGLAAPSMGLSNVMGDTLILNALIALAIGGLTNFPGAALGSLLVGLLQQVIIKYGAIGIPIPFTEIVFKPTPPLVPASTVLLMVFVLLILPNGLLGRKE